MSLGGTCSDEAFSDALIIGSRAGPFKTIDRSESPEDSESDDGAGLPDIFGIEKIFNFVMSLSRWSVSEGNKMSRMRTLVKM